MMSDVEAAYRRLFRFYALHRGVERPKGFSAEKPPKINGLGWSVM
jgi:hypothetical protein